MANLSSETLKIMEKIFKPSKKIWQRINHLTEILIIISFILFGFINLITFFYKNFASILGDPSRKHELSFEFFKPGFVALWFLVSTMLIYWLFYKKYLFQKNTTKSRMPQKEKIANLSQKVLIRFAFPTIYTVILFVFLYYFAHRVLILTNSHIFAILAISLLIFTIFCFTKNVK